MTEWLLLAFAGAGMLSLALGVLGPFVVWNRMAYFGDTIAHSALLGVAISLISNGQFPVLAAVACVAVTIAVLLTRQWGDGRVTPDAMIGILAHSALAISLLAVALSGQGMVDMESYLFGNISQITPRQVGIIAAISIAAIAIVLRHWRALLMVTLDPAVAAVEGVNVVRTRLVLTVTLALVVAASITMVGALLVTALLIIPAAAARYRARTPCEMVAASCVIALAATAIGLLLAPHYDAPVAPAIVVAATGLLLLSRLFARR